MIFKDLQDEAQELAIKEYIKNWKDSDKVDTEIRKK